MKRIFLVLFLLQGCAAIAGTKPPTGEQVLDELFKNTSLALSQEPDCKQFSATRNTSEVTLGQHLATILSVSYQSNNIVSLSSSCSDSKYEASNAKLIDVWDCKFEMKESNPGGEFISSALVSFYLSKDTLSLIKGGIRCF